MKVLVFDTKPYDKLYFDRENLKYGFEIKYMDLKLSADTAPLAAGYDVVCAFVNDTIDAKAIETLHKLGVKGIAMRCAGYNNVDMKAAFGLMPIVRVPRYSPYAIAEHAMAMLLTLNRKIHKAYNRTREGNFSLSGLLGFDLHGKTAGIIGTGQIGRCFIDICKGFGMNILGYDLYPAKNAGINYVSLEEIFRNADIISLHCPLTAETHHLIDTAAVAQMKEGVVLINTSRGALIDTTALIDGLRDKHIGAAGLDVYEEESEIFFEDYSHTIIQDDQLARLLSFNNVIITSHQGFFTHEAIEKIAEVTFQNIRALENHAFLENEICYQCGIDKSICPKSSGKNCF